MEHLWSDSPETFPACFCPEGLSWSLGPHILTAEWGAHHSMCKLSVSPSIFSTVIPPSAVQPSPDILIYLLQRTRLGAPAGPAAGQLFSELSGGGEGRGLTAL